MIFFTATHPLEILLNASEDVRRLTFAVLFDQPFARIAIKLLIVASTYAMAQGKHIFYNRSGAGWATQRYPMIQSKRVPKAAWSPAHGTAIIEVIKRPLIVFLTKCTWQCAYSCAPAIFRRPIDWRVLSSVVSRVIRVIPKPLFVARLDLVGMPASPFLRSLSIFLRIIGVSLAAAFIYKVAVSIQPSFAGLLPHTFRIFGSTLAHIRGSLRSVAIAAASYKPLFGLPDEIFTGKRFERTAFEAVVSGEGLINHSLFTSDSLPSEVSAGGGKNRCSGATLADCFIIPQRREVCHV